MKPIYFCFLVLFSTLLLAQGNTMTDSLNQEFQIEKVKRFSLGAKLGIPNVIGGSAEVVLPFFHNRLAPYLDYNNFSFNLDKTADLSLSYIEYGANFYLKDQGKGFYVGLGNAKMKTDLHYNELVFNGNGMTITDSAKVDFDLDTFNVKMGIKSGGTFYFRFELGFGIGTVPDAVKFTAVSNGITEEFTKDVPAIPGITSNGILIGNVGFGFSF